MQTGKLRIAQTGNYLAYCPGCKEYHVFDKRWTFNGDFENPSFTPSLLVKGGDNSICHSYLTDGEWRFCGDSTHGLAGQTVPMCKPHWSGDEEGGETISEKEKE